MAHPVPLHAVPPTPIGLGDRIRAHRDETSALAAEHVAELVDAIRAVERLSGEIAGGGDPYKPGIREVARQAGDAASGWIVNLSSLMGRA